MSIFEFKVNNSQHRVWVDDLQLKIIKTWIDIKSTYVRITPNKQKGKFKNIKLYSHGFKI